MGFNLLTNEAASISPEEVRHVQLRVCGAARDAAEAREMLDFLGILPGPGEDPGKPEHYELCVRWKHRLTPENTVFGDRGGRKCKACRDEMEAKRKTAPVSVAPPGRGQDPNFCRNGHLKVQYGYHTRKNGLRECMKCFCDRSIREREIRAARRTGPRRKDCTNGHEFLPENTRLGAKGRRMCTTCEDERRKSLTT